MSEDLFRSLGKSIDLFLGWDWKEIMIFMGLFRVNYGEILEFLLVFEGVRVYVIF
jgi:hypothetical protein